jgi:hypothetical protein
MSKTLKASNLSERPASRTLLAVSLCATMAAFGCTTDRNVSNGDPVVTPGVRTSPTGGTSGGSETGNTPPPMMSSYSGEALPAVQPRRVARVSAAEAAAILAEQQPRVRYLGVGYPGTPNRPYVSDGQTNLFTYPAQQVNPRVTVNSSITSGPTPVVTSGAGEGVGGGVDAATAEFLDASGAVFDTGTGVTGATAASTFGGSTLTGTGTALGTNVTNAGTVATVTPSATAVSPTAAATVVPSGLAATRSLSPTAAAVVNPPASISSLATQSSTIAGRTLSPTAASVANAPASVSALPAAATRTATTSRRTTAAATNTTTTGTATGTATTGTAATASANAGVSNPVRVVTDANGRVVVTNQSQR